MVDSVEVALVVAEMAVEAEVDRATVELQAVEAAASAAPRELRAASTGKAR